MNSPLLSSFSAVEDVLFNFAQDAGVSDYQSLQAGVIPGVATVILTPNQDGIEQITAFLQQNPQITRIHLVSHGALGCFIFRELST